MPIVGKYSRKSHTSMNEFNPCGYKLNLLFLPQIKECSYERWTTVKKGFYVSTLDYVYTKMLKILFMECRT